MADASAVASNIGTTIAILFMGFLSSMRCDRRPM
jgi:hypothetical protein